LSLWQGKHGRRAGKIPKVRTRKRKFEMGRDKTETGLGEERARNIDVRGGNRKRRLLVAEHANVTDPSKKKAAKLKILSVVENNANPHFVRRNIITKGAILETELGKVKVTSRTGQDGIVNAVLLKK
jgi:small subunit ribosomal protein S8e